MKEHMDVGSSFCVTAASHMQRLLEQRDFASVIECYQANRVHMDAAAGGRTIGEILHLVAQAYASLTNYPAALQAVRKAQAMIEQSGDAPLLAEVFITLGGILRDTGELLEAKKAYRDAESIFRRYDCPEGQSRALNHLAGLHFRGTDYRNALAVLMDAVEIARKLNDRRKLAFMMGNLGRLYTFMGNFAEAVKHLKINIAISSELHDELEALRARLSLGYVQMQKGEFEKAQEQFALAALGLRDVNSPRDEVIYLTYQGELNYRTGDFGESGRLLRKALERAELISSGSTLAGRVMRHLAELHLLTDEGRLAEKMAAKSLRIMRAADDKVSVGALRKILALAKASGRRPLGRRRTAEVRRLMRRAIDILDESGVRWEKTEALVAAGSCDAFDERQRLTYLFRAEEFYAHNGLTVGLEKVSRLISEISYLEPPMRTAPVGREVEPGVDYLTNCAVIEKIKKQLPMITRPDLPVLMTGETGVGKDHLARYFHSLVRPGKPYVAVNCASVPETLLESELFGYRKGAFTGADRDQIGLLRAADGGVFLLDEIGDMPLMLQAKLLGVLESRKVTPLGGTKQIDIDIILVAATNKNLEQMVEEGSFRRDLFYRLSGIRYHLPPLRERKEDIPLLLEHYMRQRGLLPADGHPSPDLLQHFLAHDWPGNIRELANTVARLDVMSQSVAEGDLQEVARSILLPDVPIVPGGLFDRVEQFERQLITEALLAARGNKSEAARILGIHEATVRTKLKRYGISMEGAA
jgi:DNA-binding NtrC family response regulator/tetratricopeptide (TPR) repeat protein